MTSPQFEGEIEYSYDDDGNMRRFEIRATLSADQLQWILTHIPVDLDKLYMLREHFRRIKSPADIREYIQKIDFDIFWSRWFAGRNKDNSSKKKAQTKWNRMTKSEQLKAYQYIGKYMNKLGAGVGIKYAETYLNSDLWNNN
jgi:hypothetical protein